MAFMIILSVAILLVVFGLIVLMNVGVCYHKIVEGGGGMGDGIDCEKCSLSTYYFPLLWFYEFVGRVRKI